MWQTLLLAFFAGVFGANGIPHFVKGITKEYYPCLLGNTPIPNLLAGWGMFMLAACFLRWGHVQLLSSPAFFAAAAGALLMGLFHAGPGAFGRK